MSIHANLTGADLHEPKGVASASAGTVYVADGSGSGTWETTPQQVNLSRTMPNISGSAGTVYIPSPVTGTIVAIYAVLEATISGAGATLTAAINGTSITGGAFTTGATDTAGTEYSVTPSSLNTVTPGSVISIATDGASTGTAPMTFVVVIDVT